MAVEPFIEALDSPTPVKSLYEAVKNDLYNGVTRYEVISRLEQIRASLEDEESEEPILRVMSFLCARDPSISF